MTDSLASVINLYGVGFDPSLSIVKGNATLNIFGRQDIANSLHVVPTGGMAAAVAGSLNDAFQVA